MSIFKKETTKKIAKKTEKKDTTIVAVKNESGKFSFASCIIRPRITEKAAFMNEKGVYVFEISKDATKGKVSKAIKEIYGKIPARVNVVKNPSKEVMRKGKVGHTKEVRKAYVYLKSGEKIEIV